LRSQRFAKHEELMEAVGARLSTHTQHTLWHEYTTTCSLYEQLLNSGSHYAGK
jgi:hypothetical protein